MNKEFKSMTSPYQLPNGVILRNRMIIPPSEPHNIQATENYPSEGTIMHYARRAQNGAALVTCDGCYLKQDPTGKHMEWDIRNAGAQHYMTQLVDAVHFYGAKANAVIMPFIPEGYDVSPDVDCPFPKGIGAADTEPYIVEELPKDLIYELIETWANQARLCANAGFDGVYIHMAYRATLCARFISPVTNHRKDEFGGTLENRIRFPLLLCKRIKELCGKQFIIECTVSGHDMTDDEGHCNGAVLDDTIEFAKRSKGLIDIMTLRSPHIDPQHPTGFNLKHTPWVYMAEAVKKAEPGIAVAASGGLFYPDECNAIIKNGQADLLSMARAFISNPDYGKCVYEGRGEDIVPCLRCNKCHMLDAGVELHSACVVNPQWANEIRVDRLISPVEREKKVAIIGGGPAGMKAAFEAAQRGHQVTLFEKSSHLGGLAAKASLADFKWPMRDYLTFMNRKLQEQTNIELKLNCAPDPAYIKEQNYDVLIAALGSHPLLPEINGVSDARFMQAVDAFEHEAELGKRIIVVGGGEIGSETGLYLARKGHDVTVVCRQSALAVKARRVHYYTMFVEAMEKQEGFAFILNAVTKEVRSDGITYADKDGKLHDLPCDDVVLSCGAAANGSEAMRFAECAREFYVIGDCDHVADMQKAIRSGFSVANSI